MFNHCHLRVLPTGTKQKRSVPILTKSFQIPSPEALLSVGHKGRELQQG